MNFIHSFRFLFSFRLAYLRPFVNEIGAVSKFVLKSQWKYQVPFELAKKQVNNGSSSSFKHLFMLKCHIAVELIYEFRFIFKSSTALFPFRYIRSRLVIKTNTKLNIE